MSEASIINAIRRFLETVPGCFAWKTHGGIYGTAGIPDIIACLPRLNGRMVGIEVKAPGKRNSTTPNQDRELKAINKAGGFAIVVDNVEQLKSLGG